MNQTALITDLLLLNKCNAKCQLTVEQTQLQQRRQGRDDHEHEEAAAPTHQAHRWAQGHAGRHGDASHGEVVCIEVVEHGGLLGLGVHHTAGEAVVDPVAGQPVVRQRD